MADNQGTTPAQGAQDSGMTFDTTPVKQDTPISSDTSGMTFDAAPVKEDTPVQPVQVAKPRIPYNEAAFGRYTTPEDYPRWAATPPKSGPDIKPGEAEAWVGAHLTPREALEAGGKTVAEGGLAAGTALGLTAIPEALPAVLTHTIDGVKAVGAWANKNPVQAYMLFQTMKELLPGMKKAMGIVKGVPETE